MSSEALSKREREVVAELQSGGRVPTIAKKLAISPTTVRNHLQRIFWKLGVHSQSELIEYVQNHPETLGTTGSRESDREAARTEARYWESNARLAAEIDAILKERWGPESIYEVFHRALPLGNEGREEWRARLAMWSREEPTGSELDAKRAIEEGMRVLMPGSCGAELVSEINPAEASRAARAGRPSMPDRARRRSTPAAPSRRPSGTAAG